MPEGRRSRFPRVAVLTRSMYPLHGVGGLERHVFDLVRYHLADGMRVWLVTRAGQLRGAQAADAWASLTTHPAFSHAFVPYPSVPLAGRRGTTILDRSTAYPVFGRRVGRLVAGEVAARGVDVVYGLGASAYGYALARRRRGAAGRAPLVLNPQGMEEFGGADGRYGGQRLKGPAYAPLRRVVRAAAAAADAVVATDRVLQPVVQHQLAVESSRVRVIPNGIDLRMCDTLAGPADGRALRQALRIDSSEALLLSVGRIERNKGFHHLAAALSAWSDRPGWSWAIVGDGPHWAALDHAIGNAGIASRVRRVGRVPDATLHTWYEAADLFVHPTVYEGSSLVTLEAMAHRLPVLVTRAGGLPDKVVDDVTGWLVPPADVGALRRGLTRAFDRRLDWRTMGASGRALAGATFDWPVIQSAFRSLYEDLLR